MDQRQSLGKRGEDLACAELERRGYVIVDRRFRTRCGELDIVARDGGVLVFIEVKTGQSNLTTRERQVRDAVKGGRVEWLELRRDG